jgi:hypothetical protein
MTAIQCADVRRPGEITPIVHVMEGHHDQIDQGMLMYEGDPEVVKADLARMPPKVRETMKKTAPQAYEAHSLRVHGTLPSRSAD